MHFIVTGGAGFIGSHLVEQLLREGHNITVVDNLSTGKLANLPQHSCLKFVHKNILDCQPKDFLEPVHGIAHLAATPSVTESWYEPLKSHHNNLSAMVSLMLLIQSLKIPRLVFASSAAVYGNKVELPVSEEQPKVPISPYGLQKLFSEQYANLFAQKLNISFIALRLFNVFGPRQDPSSVYSGVISIFTKCMQKGLPITIYGNGMQTRDFIYVKDVAVAFSKALTVPLPASYSVALNVGTSKETSLLQLLNVLQTNFSRWDSAIKFTEARPGDIQHSQANISKISSILNFYPQWSIETGIQMLIESLNSPVSVKVP